MLTISSVDEFVEQVSKDVTTCVMFSAVWCGPCKQIAKQMNKLTYEFPDVSFLKVDADDNADIMHKCRVSALPTFMLCRQGQVLGHVIGSDVKELSTKIKEVRRHAVASQKKS